jgi:hypothetical protein
MPAAGLHAQTTCLDPGTRTHGTHACPQHTPLPPKCTHRCNEHYTAGCHSSQRNQQLLRNMLPCPPGAHAHGSAVTVYTPHHCEQGAGSAVHKGPTCKAAMRSERVLFAKANAACPPLQVGAVASWATNTAPPPALRQREHPHQHRTPALSVTTRSSTTSRLAGSAPQP